MVTGASIGGRGGASPRGRGQCGLGRDHDQAPGAVRPRGPDRPRRPAGAGTALRWLPEFVLIDIGLPAMDGHEVAARLRQEPSCRETILIAVTGYGQPEDRQRSRAAGINYYLLKPVPLPRCCRCCRGPRWRPAARQVRRQVPIPPLRTHRRRTCPVGIEAARCPLAGCSPGMSGTGGRVRRILRVRSRVETRDRPQCRHVIGMGSDGYEQFPCDRRDGPHVSDSPPVLSGR